MYVHFVEKMFRPLGNPNLLFIQLVSHSQNVCTLLSILLIATHSVKCRKWWL